MPTVKIEGRGDHWNVDEFPGTCPICHHAIDPRYLSGVLRKSQVGGATLVELAFQCPQKDCLHLFIGCYSGHSSPGTSVRLQLRSSTPFSPKPPLHSEQVTAVSAQFVEIYAESAAAEAWKLTQIAGCGYRKALEFLVKDYSILVSGAQGDAEKEDAIKKKFLANVITEHLPGTDIQACAERATWLGNDESHYVRKWPDKDIGDLKNLIALVESWITTKERTKMLLGAMPKGST
jgi:hypothetical protein